MPDRYFVIDRYYLSSIEKYLNNHSIPYAVEYPPREVGSTFVELTLDCTDQEAESVHNYMSVLMEWW